ncbi:potassium-transporting ATPase subunit KdpA [Gordonia alkaliphila]|uniref:potassium-transporting ATPase subunit KdpA n=1 Tax=Gordonia alkaliphila TaxID=1053547 RepID=UPI001FF31765|nr:potassium-transporting ATPase subunit KdpA [Gordonia alkaliphila]MCK0439369.1 potassium-transporting ATPase subunit KdpA [Gordonia alkaliphila]
MTETTAGLLQLGALLAVLALVYVPFGDYLAAVFRSRRHLAPERGLYRLARIDPDAGQTWRAYATSVLGFSFAAIVLLYALQRLQGVLPWNDSKPGVTPAMAFNTAISFVTNTNWQSYSPETTVSNLTQMLGFAVQNFLSAAVGLAVAVALIRGLIARNGNGLLGNFWVDLVRGTLRVLLPVAILIAGILLLQGAVQSWHTGVGYTLLDGRSQASPLGPFASQEAIKVLGTNGGGTFGANSAHPFSNPTPLTNVVQVFAILLIPVCLTRAYGTMVGDRRQGLTLLAVMATLWAGLLAGVWFLQSRTSGIAAVAAGANTEGTELRFGVPGTSLFAVSTTGTSTGAVNAAHDSLSPGAGGAVLWNMLLGEVAPGGVGSGLYGILILATITVFLGGLLVGRTPEILGKKVGRREITVAVLSVLVMPTLVLAGTSLTLATGASTGHFTEDGPPGSPVAVHGFTEVLYAYASTANNNGSAFGGLIVTSDWFQVSLGLVMYFGRFLPIVLVLALAGMFARQKPRDDDPVAEVEAEALVSSVADEPLDSRAPQLLQAPAPSDAGVLPTSGPLFGALLLGTTLLIAGLTFLPALALGPIAEALL